MRTIPPELKTFLGLTVGIFLLLLLIHIALPAVFLLFRVPSFAIGADPIWLMRWSNTARGFGIQFNLLLLIAIALLIGFIRFWLRRH